VGQIGVLKAIGASSWFVFRQLLLQVLIVSFIGMAIALPITIVTVSVLSADVPLLLERDKVLLSGFLLLVTAVVGVLFSGRRIATVDPLIALGQQQ
jgi:putative ABC transport system permease protein